MLFIVQACAALSAVAVLACKGSQQGQASQSATATTTASAAVTDTVKPDFHDPKSPGMRATAPATFNAKVETSAGTFVIEVHRDWAPQGADRFYNLARSGYFENVRFFRVIPGFMAQFGIHGDPAVSASWRSERIPDDPVKQSNGRGMITFATAGPGTRTTQLFINFGDNRMLDGQGFAPFGRVTEGMDVVDKIFGGYGEGAPGGRGPDQGRIQAQGNAYLEKDFPKLDYIKSVTVTQ
jgi:peptidyl-prolyl cis-trans isomerase A (cyclophilin A)